jgi:hypothetical protein
VTNERIPKAEWPPGPWHNEPDALDWRDERTALTCAIRRTPLTGSLCGYVGVQPGHAFHGWRYDDDVPLQPGDLEGTIDDVGVFSAFIYGLAGGPKEGTIPLGMVLKVHGGISWSGEALRDLASGLWWFGFDCGHAGDYCPAIDAVLRRIMPPEHMRERAKLFIDDKYRDLEYVRTEVTHLAWQLRQLEARVIAVPAWQGAKGQSP